MEKLFNHIENQRTIIDDINFSYKLNQLRYLINYFYDFDNLKIKRIETIKDKLIVIIEHLSFFEKKITLKEEDLIKYIHYKLIFEYKEDYAFIYTETPTMYHGNVVYVYNMKVIDKETNVSRNFTINFSKMQLFFDLFNEYLNISNKE